MRLNVELGICWMWVVTMRRSSKMARACSGEVGLPEWGAYL